MGTQSEGCWESFTRFELFVDGGLTLPFLAFLIASYAFLGGGIKYIDQVYDERIGSRTAARLLAVSCGLLMGACMVLDGAFSTAFFMAMLISLVITRKIDNWCFLVGTVLALLTFIAGALLWGAELLPLPIVIFLVAGAVDEIVDGLAHRMKLGPVVGYVLHYRPFSDIALVAIILIVPFDWHYLMPYFAFTLCYMFMSSMEEGQVRDSVREVLRKAAQLRP